VTPHWTDLIAVLDAWFESAWLPGASVLALLCFACIRAPAWRRRFRARGDPPSAQALSDQLDETRRRLADAEDTLSTLGRVDALTGLASRERFEQCLREAAARQPPLLWFTVLAVDLDGFRLVNESLGHEAGDSVLREAARRIGRAVRPGDVAARVGADEFLVLLQDTHGQLDDGVQLAAQVVGALARPLRMDDLRLSVSASVGIAVYPDHGPVDRMMSRAALAMQRAKTLGGGRWSLFEPWMETDARDALALGNDLRHALAGGEFGLLYQPKVDARSGAISGVEALLRWHHPLRGEIAPAAFIPLAERHGLIAAIGDWVIGEACRQMHEWTRQGLALQVAVNVSVHQLRDGGLVGRIEQALAMHEVDAADLVCEITESAAMDDLHATHRALDGLGRLGVSLSIDDFGTGHSSLGQLRRLRVRQLKLDASFVRDLDHNADACTLVEAVVRLAHSLRLRVVAEGVETTSQRDLLVDMGCDEMQGYLFARPMSADALVAWAQRRRLASAASAASTPASPSGSASVKGERKTFSA
jgi:diguanylate cyclase (GGDEF)-like protein